MLIVGLLFVNSEIRIGNWNQIQKGYSTVQGNIVLKIFKNLTTVICFPFYNLADFLEEHRRVLDQRLQPVVREITDSRARTRDELEGKIYTNSPVTNCITQYCAS